MPLHALSRQTIEVYQHYLVDCAQIVPVLCDFCSQVIFTHRSDHQAQVDATSTSEGPIFPTFVYFSRTIWYEECKREGSSREARVLIPQYRHIHILLVTHYKTHIKWLRVEILLRCQCRDTFYLEQGSTLYRTYSDKHSWDPRLQIILLRPCDNKMNHSDNPTRWGTNAKGEYKRWL